MGKIYYISIIALLVLTSCSKKTEIKPDNLDKLETSFKSIIKIDNMAYSKVADMYAVGREKESENVVLHNSSFNITANGEQSVIAVSIISSNNIIENGIYYLEDAKECSSVNVVDAKGINWSSKNGHQKGSNFEIVKVETLHDGIYYQKVTVKIVCYVYNKDGDVRTVELSTDIKY